MSKQKESIPFLVLVLFCVTFAVALLLGLVNQTTAPKIEENQQNAVKKAMAEIIPGAEFAPIDIGEQPEDSIVSSAYAATVDGAAAGYCITTTPNGYGGELTVIVGITDGAVAGVKVTSHSETPGLGAKAQDSEWISQFIGMPADGALSVDKDGGSVVSISGATVTSRAVSAGVNAAAEFAASLNS